MHAGRDDAPALGLVVPLMVNDHPVFRLSQFVGTPGVGKQDGEMPIAHLGMHDRKPGFMCRVEPTGGYQAQRARSSLVTIGTVDFEQKRIGRLARSFPKVRR